MARLAGDDGPALLYAAALASHRTGEGHVCADLAAVAGGPLVAEVPDGPGTPALAAWTDALRRTAVVGGPDDDAPLVLDLAGRLYLRRYWAYERELARDLLARASAPVGAVDDARLRAAVAAILPTDIEAPAPDWQRVAAVTAVLRRLCVISGGPGTGKTSTVVRLLGIARRPRRRRPAAGRAGGSDGQGSGPPGGGDPRRARPASRAAPPRDPRARLHRSSPGRACIATHPG